MGENREVKTLASCTPSEFAKQTVLIRKQAKEWMEATDIVNVFRSTVHYKTAPDNATAEERAEIIRENAKIQQDEGMKRASKVFDAAMEKNPEKTLELLALCCFVEPDKVDDYPMSFYMDAFTSLINNPSVLRFFTSLATLNQMTTSKQ